MSQETQNNVPHDITLDGKYGIYDTGFPQGLQQQAVVYFPNGLPKEEQTLTIPEPSSAPSDIKENK